MVRYNRGHISQNDCPRVRAALATSPWIYTLVEPTSRLHILDQHVEMVLQTGAPLARARKKNPVISDATFSLVRHMKTAQRTIQHQGHQLKLLRAAQYISGWARATTRLHLSQTTNGTITEKRQQCYAIRFYHLASMPHLDQVIRTATQDDITKATTDKIHGSRRRHEASP